MSRTHHNLPRRFCHLRMRHQSASSFEYPVGITRWFTRPGSSVCAGRLTRSMVGGPPGEPRWEQPAFPSASARSPTRALPRCPSPSDGDLFFDLQSDAYAAEGRIEYLFGVADRDGAPGQGGSGHGDALIHVEVRLESGDAAGVPEPLRAESEGFNPDDCFLHAAPRRVAGKTSARWRPLLASPPLRPRSCAVPSRGATGPWSKVMSTSAPASTNVGLPMRCFGSAWSS